MVARLLCHNFSSMFSIECQVSLGKLYSDQIFCIELNCVPTWKYCIIHKLFSLLSQHQYLVSYQFLLISWKHFHPPPTLRLLSTSSYWRGAKRWTVILWYNQFILSGFCDWNVDDIWIWLITASLELERWPWGQTNVWSGWSGLLVMIELTSHHDVSMFPPSYPAISRLHHHNSSGDQR